MKLDELILFDWFSFTAKHHGPESVIRLLGMNPAVFEPMYGVRGYSSRLYYDGINIHYGGEKHDHVWCEMSGKGCRAFETFGSGNWKALFEETLSDKEYHITRLDAAFDDHVGTLDLKRLSEYVLRRSIVTEFKRNGVTFDLVGDQEAITIYHGSPKSDVYFRIYDKAMERNREDEGHWVRFEIQMRDDHARRFLDLMVLQDVGDVFAKTVNQYIRYVDDPGTDSNKRRWPTAAFWYNFISTTEKVKLYQAPGVEYNFDNLKKYVEDQAGAAVAAYVKLVLSKI